MLGNGGVGALALVSRSAHVWLPLNFWFGASPSLPCVFHSNFTLLCHDNFVESCVVLGLLRSNSLALNRHSADGSCSFEAIWC